MSEENDKAIFYSLMRILQLTAPQLNILAQSVSTGLFWRYLPVTDPNEIISDRFLKIDFWRKISEVRL